MIKSLWTAKTGLESQQTKLDVISNNLANVSTNGFKRSRPVFEDLLYQNMRQPGAQNNIQDRLPSGMQVGTGVRAVATERLHTQGGLEQTENSRDLAINGEGFFQVLMSDGTTAYTRDGSFQLNENGQMVTANGYPVEPAIFLPANALSVNVGEDGTVSVRQPGVTVDNEVGQISVSTFINPAGLQSIGGNLYLETGASGAPNENIPGMNGAGRLFQGYVETSNVNVVEEMVNMIQTQRAYEINSKAVSTSDEMLARLSQL
ncbi:MULTISPECIES: flagellar basal-body rod protein FlgG [Halomonadaceae]|uniref:flagellar basal-body rod protein FlgG n=1 Tax=Halomonadaceae TaxID=28256 RepID=UPI0012F3C90F|nr:MULTISPECIES: flagellar basal-body rod protein FlgG [Halomonas]QNU63524.1 flagellar basal-body rod protein FlgG [Halomonas titanicae]CAD5246296.1 flagellar component of cell-distal portion of basal-body rod [Halomonas sp. I3]CAD5267877.1 flagellar component of cell-distal portion of basal-body rod [Halomonas sp. 113]CAD5269794.1 flagellar component of cell-distal portion of basal-body rod [Halomonas sp. 59]CAD5283806.1 flagellar component of cell-distal portion of basal-body rod [Halomonas 